MTSVARLIVALFLTPCVVSLPCNDPNAQVEHVCAKMKKVITSDGGDGLGDHYKRRVVSTGTGCCCPTNALELKAKFSKLGEPEKFCGMDVNEAMAMMKMDHHARCHEAGVTALHKNVCGASESMVGDLLSQISSGFGALFTSNEPEPPRVRGIVRRGSTPGYD